MITNRKIDNHYYLKTFELLMSLIEKLQAQPHESHSPSQEGHGEHPVPTKLFTKNLTAQTSAQEDSQEHKLSNFILNNRQFWENKLANSAKENSDSNALQIISRLPIESVPNELPAVSFDKKKTLASLLGLESKISMEEESEIVMESQITCKEGISQNQEFQHTAQNKGRAQEGRIGAQLGPEGLKKLRQTLEKIKIIEHISLVGYWCSFYLGDSRVKWELICILLYKQASQQLSLLQSSLFAEEMRRHRIFTEEIQQNLNKMIEVYQEHYTIPEDTKRLLMSDNYEHMLPAILKEGKKFMGSIMKPSHTHKTYQFCLLKVLNSIALVAKMNGYIVDKIEPCMEVSVDNLKQHLLLYKQLSKNYKNAA